MEKKIKKLYLTGYNLLTVKDLWQAHYQILSILFLKEFVKSNVQTVIHVVLNKQTLRKKVYKCLCCNKDYQKIFDGDLKNRFTNANNYSGDLLCCWEKVFIQMNT